MLRLLKKILGISLLEDRVKALEASGKTDTLSDEKQEIFDILTGKMTTEELSQELGKSRSWISSLINEMEREGKVRESGKKGRAVLYERQYTLKGHGS